MSLQQLEHTHTNYKVFLARLFFKKTSRYCHNPGVVSGVVSGVVIRRRAKT